MKIERSQALAMCKAVGLATADGWDNNVMAEKMEAIPDLKNLEQLRAKIVDKGLKNLLDALCKAVEDEKTITVIGGGPKKVGVKASSDEDDDETEESEDDEEEEPSDDEDEDEEMDVESNGKPKKGKGKKATKVKGKDKPKKKAEKAEYSKDAWGFRKPTRTANINAVFMKGKAKTVAEVEKEAKATSIHSHVYKLVKMGLVKRRKEDNKLVVTDKGLKMAKK